MLEEMKEELEGAVAVADVGAATEVGSDEEWADEDTAGKDELAVEGVRNGGNTATECHWSSD